MSKAHTRRLRTRSLELLERRDTPAAWGNPWPQPGELTLSFAPDGTKVGAQTSGLVEALRDSSGGDPAWQREILRALQTWINVANIDLAVVPDSGRDFGQDGGAQGSREQGDFRISAIPLSSQELAVAAPFDLLDDWSGDILLNTNYRFGMQSGQFDLFSVFLQESGHALGLGNSEAVDSVMYSGGYQRRSGLAPSDVAGIRSLYGARQADRFEGSSGNDRLGLARPLEFIVDAEQANLRNPQASGTPLVAVADITHKWDVDFYRVTLPAQLNDFWVELRTEGLSLLTSRVTVLDSQGRTVSTLSATDPLQGNLRLFVKDARPGARYYVKVQGVGEFGIGQYHLAVGKETTELLFPAVQNFYNDDKLDDDDGVSEPVALPLQSSAIEAAWDATFRGSISYAGDADVYRLSVSADTTAQAMVLAAWDLDGLKLDPRIQVYTDTPDRLPVASEVLRSETGKYVIQVKGDLAGRSFLVEVQAQNSQGQYKEGNYLLGVNLRRASVDLESFASGTLNTDSAQQALAIENPRTTLLHFVLAAQADSTSAELGVLMTVFDEQRQPVYSLAVRPGEENSVSLLLAAGRYTVQILGISKQGEPLNGAIAYTLQGLIRNDPIGPQPIGTVTWPIGGTSPTAPPNTWAIYRAYFPWMLPVTASPITYRSY